MATDPTPEQVARVMAEMAAKDRTAEARARFASTMPPAGAGYSNSTLSNDQLGQLVEDLARSGVPRDQAEAAAKADGWVPPTPLTAEQKEAAEWGLPANPQAVQYEIELPREMASALPFDRQSNLKAALSDMVAAVGLDTPLGNAVARHLAETGPALKLMSADQLSAWHSQQHRMAVSVLGSAEAVQAAQAKAIKLLEGSALGREVARSSLAKSAWLISTLSIHADHVASFNSRRK